VDRAAVGLCIGVAVGLVTDFSSQVGLSAFITTLALSSIVRGAAYVISGGQPIPLSNLPAEFKFLGRGLIGKAGVPFTILLFLVVILAFDFLCRRSTVMRKVYYVGSKRMAERFLESSRRVRLGVSSFSGSFCLAGIPHSPFQLGHGVLRRRSRLAGHIGLRDRRRQPHGGRGHHPGSILGIP
jgi:ribose transport system permease protein